MVARVVADIRATPRVRIDRTRLLQVVVNTILNAADACEGSLSVTPTITITVGRDGRGDAQSVRLL
jgi:C4-dicarboxylate-specific signal transduction histidine kinase